jgi:hypothetical protein
MAKSIIYKENTRNKNNQEIFRKIIKNFEKFQRIY